MQDIHSVLRGKLSLKLQNVQGVWVPMFGRMLKYFSEEVVQGFPRVSVERFWEENTEISWEN